MLKAFEMNMKGEGGISRRSLRPLFGSHLHPFVQSKANGGQEAAGVRCPFSSSPTFKIELPRL